jgi:hypothetical protein
MLAPVGMGVRAQTFDEWFRQKDTQLEYLRQQIAALQTYVTVTEDGYRTVEQGTGSITVVKKEEDSLHQDYFAGLVKVRLEIGRDPVIGATKALQRQLVNLAVETNMLAKVLPDWPETLATFFQGMLTDCSNDLELLQKLTTDGQVQLTDAERLEGINVLYRRMQTRYRAGMRVRETVVFLRNNLML